MAIESINPDWIREQLSVNSPKEGGETPIADVRKAFERIDPKTRETFAKKKVMYVRNFGGAFGLKWQDVFQTEEKSVMQAYCKKVGIKFEWREKNRLKTRQVHEAILKHPETGESVWFNHAAVLNVSTLPLQKRKMLLKMLNPEDLPNNTFYGDGSDIEPESLDEIRDAYEKETVLFNWKEGDVLMLDNMLAAHARKSFVGPRKVVVGMADPMNRSELNEKHLIINRKEKMSKEELRKFLKETIENSAKNIEGELTDNCSLIQSGLIDSIALLNLALWIEKRIGFEIDMTSIDPIEEWDSLSRIYHFIENKKRNRNG